MGVSPQDLVFLGIDACVAINTFSICQVLKQRGRWGHPAFGDNINIFQGQPDTRNRSAELWLLITEKHLFGLEHMLFWEQDRISGSLYNL